MKKVLRRLQDWARRRKRHPISSLPPEIISRIFVFCLPPLGTAPSCKNAPLLTAQICRSWRELTLQTPELWVDIRPVCGGKAAAEMMKVWSSRAESLPLHYILISWDAEEADSLVEAVLQHQQRWGLLFMAVPWSAYARMHTLGASFPVLYHIQLVIQGGDSTPTLESSKLIFHDAPKLRTVAISSFGGCSEFPMYLLEIPWGQLESLKVAIGNDTWAENMSTLLQCTNLTELTISSNVQQTPMPAQITNHITLPFLQSLKLDNPYLVELLDHVTLPRLHQLEMGLFGDRDDFRRMQSLFSRAACPIQYLKLTLGDPGFLRRIMALTPLVVELVLRIESMAPNILGLVGTALQPGVLPVLQTLEVGYPTASMTGRDVLVETLMGRSARLRSFALHSAGNTVDMIPYTNLALAGVKVKVSAG
ncbi:F-box domain-containing protein [Mycena sanguinolenta]|uniref:F-box domain-containing protein n=1 Tax=Mycena sanguinolenta TaxID=230812 RepID=A0A8H6Y089_9AGAR|nr:F-box domain-containing protein [Mycena sanguinolenta]